MMVRKCIIAIDKFIEEYGLSLFVTLATGSALLLITIGSWFWPGIYAFVSNTHVFEAIVLLTLIEIVVLLTRRKGTDNVFDVYEQDTDAQAKIFELVKHSALKRVTILSSGLASRRLLIAPLACKGITVEVLAQDPETSLDKQDLQRLHEAIDWIKMSVGDKDLTNLKFIFHANVTSLRAVILYEAHSKIRHAFFGWYTYSNRNTVVRGSQHPTLYVSTCSRQGEHIVKWIESVIEYNRKESREVPAEF